MSSIDERVVNMKFNNSQFAAGVSQTVGLLDTMKKSLNLDAATKSVQGLDDAGKKFSLAGMASGVESLASKFSTLSIIGVAALATITSKAVSSGLELAKSLTIAPIMQGLQEYETQLNSVQTIMANTSAKGTTLKQVNAALNELNTYSDKTIYNFSEMSRNIGTFTAAGVDLKTSTAAIKGIANLAALSGSNSEQASTAMYQLSQALAAGKVGLQDWNSVVNAGMGGQVFQDAIKETARNQGVAVDSAIKKYGSFRESLQSGWLTGKVLTETLSKFTGDLNAEQLKTMGYNKEQIAGIMKMAKTAQDAATKVKTMSQLMDTLKEAQGSGWATTWQIIFGDFEEAKKLFTNVSNVLGGMITSSANARNKLLGDWKALGGRTAVIDTIGSAFNSLMSILKVVGQAFKEVFPPMTGKQLYALTIELKNFVNSLKPGKQQLDEIKRIFKGFFSILDIGVTVIKAAAGMFGRLFGSATQGSGGFLTMLAKIGDWFTALDQAIKKGDNINKFFSGLGDILLKVVDGFKTLASWVGKFFGDLGKVSTSGVENAIGRVQVRLDPLKVLGENLSKIWNGFIDVLKHVGGFFAPLASKLADFFKGFGQLISDSVKTMNFNQVLDAVNTGLFAGLVLLLKKFLKGGINVDIGGGFLDTLKGAFGGLTDTLGAMQANLKAGTLMKIAIAVGVLTASVVALSLIDSAKLASALTGLGVMFGELLAAMAIIDKLASSGGMVKLPFITGAMILFAIAIDLLVIAVKAMSGLSWEELLKGLTGVMGLLLGIAGAVKLMSGVKGKLVSAGVGILAIAFAIRILVDSVKDFSKMSWDEIGRGLTGVGTLLASLAIFTRLAAVNKGAIGQGVGLILLGTAIKILASATQDFANMNPSTLQQGLGAIIGVLGALALFSRISDPKGIMATGVSMVILSAALKILVTVVSDFAKMDWETMGRGMAGLAGALFIVAAAMRAMPGNLPITAVGLVIVAAALKILASALTDMGGMSWDEIGRGLVVLAASLVIIAAAMYLMSGALPGAAALIIVAASLAILAPVLLSFANMGWDAIIQGLTMLAGVFVIIGVAGLLLTPVIPTLLGLGVAILLLGGGMVLAGVGMLAFSAGLLALSVAGAAGTAALVAIVTGLLGLIPMAFTQIGLGIVAFAKVLGDNAPVFVAAMVSLMLALLTAINTVAPQIINTLMNLIFLLVNALVVAIPRFVVAGVNLVVGILTGIGNNIGRIVDAGVNLIVQFLNGITRNIPRLATAAADVVIAFIKAVGDQGLRITNAAADMIVKFVNGLADSITTHSQEMRDAGGRLAFAIIDGMTGGLASRVQDVINGAADLGNKAIAAVKHAIDSNSPSKETFKLGGYFGWGFADGITSLTSKVEGAATGVGNTAVSTLNDTINGIASNLSSNMDMTPVIRPVLDLSAVKSSASLIGGMLDPGVISGTGSYKTAAAISASTVTVDEVVSKTGAVPAAGVNLSLTQNNYSPKELSRVELYRQTNNQLSVAKGALTKLVKQN